VILVDANLLICAIADSPQHERARTSLERVRCPAPHRVGLHWIVILAFVRITIRHGILRRPLSPANALAYAG